MKKEDNPQTIVKALKARIYTNKAGFHQLDKCFAARRRCWNFQVAYQKEMWETRKERKEKWVAEGGEEIEKKLKEDLEKNLASGVIIKGSPEHKAAKKEISGVGFSLINIAQADKDFRKLRRSNDEDYSWMQETPSRLVGDVFKRMDVAYREAWKKRRVKGFVTAKKPNKGFPRYAKYGDNNYFGCEANQIKWDWDTNKLKLPNSKVWIKFKLPNGLPEGKLKTCVFTRTATMKYYVYIVVDTGAPIPPKKKFNKSNTIGLDVGIRNYVTFSDPVEIRNSKFLEKFNLKLENGKLSPYKTDPRLTRRKSIRQRRLSRKVFKSKNYQKQKIACAKVDEKIAEKRNDFTHELSRALVETPYNAIAIEDLDIVSMKQKKAPIKDKSGKYKRNGQVQKRKLNKQINDVAWGALFSRIEYKTNFEGKSLIKANRYDPTSKMCKCGYINKGLKLSQRKWDCPKCGVKNDRDELAAKNVKTFALNSKKP
jgi:putative transposase